MPTSFKPNSLLFRLNEKVAVEIRTHLKACLALLSGLLLFACLQKAGHEVTSTSATTGNLTGIRIVFRKDSIPVSLNGKVEIFAADQIPVSGYSPSPLISLNLIEASSIEIENHWIESIPHSLWPTESIEGDSIRRISAIISSDSLGSILKGITFQKIKGRISFIKSGISLPQIGFHSELLRCAVIF